MSAEDIVTTYDIEVIARRWAATWIDFIVLFALLVAADALLGNELYQKTLFVWMGALAAYFPVLEGTTGFTAGKLLLRIRVVDFNGNPPGIGKASLRTLLRLIEVNPLFLGGLPAGIIALFSKKKQRLGDMLAGTYVVKVADLGQTAPCSLL